MLGFHCPLFSNAPQCIISQLYLGLLVTRYMAEICIIPYFWLCFNSIVFWCADVSFTRSTINTFCDVLEWHKPSQSAAHKFLFCKKMYFFLSYPNQPKTFSLNPISTFSRQPIYRKKNRWKTFAIPL